MPGPTDISEGEINQYSITHFVASGLNSLGWTTVKVKQVADGWPVYEELSAPGVYILCESSDLAGFELGSNGKSLSVFFNIYGENDAQRTRLAETIQDMVRDIVPIYNFVTGNETSPEISDHFVTDSVGWEKIPSLTTSPEKEKWRSLVTAELRRVVS